ncbi:ribbon-helix-helix domain-containing protein [Azospirillum sp. SYSU D00513]|uniref:ribbon-helix-helix domain-containing protein n=1 Tax=Azospirillum sp. SYSU D00513 TaxID=2812561 RepID=UPI001A97CE18|nr:ribbon-helix-helix domain-containing protein [Azospirillum sp. SYSU D00513]
MPLQNKQHPNAKAVAVTGTNFIVAGRRTTLRLEKPMREALQEIARIEGMTVHEIVSAVDQGRADQRTRTSAVRMFVTDYFRAAATKEGHERAGHGSGTLFGVRCQGGPSIRRITAS